VGVHITTAACRGTDGLIMVIQFLQNGEDEILASINTTPLVDVMQVLLIMPIITIPMQTHAVKLNLPLANAHPAGATYSPG